MLPAVSVYSYLCLSLGIVTEIRVTSFSEDTLYIFSGKSPILENNQSEGIKERFESVLTE